jgi:hypothetical protein
MRHSDEGLNPETPGVSAGRKWLTTVDISRRAGASPRAVDRWYVITKYETGDTRLFSVLVIA